ncbi:MAG: TM2 domain-containing protein [Bacteroidetes bacterium]|nr:MAG: TM2 domain-containing protein [Bacteroidota bacterium]
MALAAIAALAIISTTTVYASFPVNKKANKEQTVDSKKSNVETVINNTTVEAKNVKELKSADPVDKKGLDEKWILVLLWFFLGGLAAHRWYAGKPIGWNILFILTAGGCYIWAIVDLINILRDKFM